MIEHLRRMLYESGCELEVARAIKRYAGWRLSDDAARHRIMQTLSAGSPRHFAAEWLPIAVRVVAYHGGEDLVSEAIAEARYEGRRQREDLEAMARDRKPAIRKVPVREQGRGAA